MEFLEAAEPHEYLSSYNKFTISSDTSKLISKLKAPSDLVDICSDLKVCGRREMSELLKLRYKYAASKLPEEQKEELAPQELTPEQLEKAVDAELEASIRRQEREKKRIAKKEHEA